MPEAFPHGRPGIITPHYTKQGRHARAANSAIFTGAVLWVQKSPAPPACGCSTTHLHLPLPASQGCGPAWLCLCSKCIPPTLLTHTLAMGRLLVQAAHAAMGTSALGGRQVAPTVPPWADRSGPAPARAHAYQWIPVLEALGPQQVRAVLQYDRREAVREEGGRNRGALAGRQYPAVPPKLVSPISPWYGGVRS